ncbi:ThiF family adenylyltransferase [Cytobacillus suaedae]|nr:ThiF family adenylyltransferase [Cytobacillus suaedae]
MLQNVKLRMSGQQHSALFHHLYPGDNKEAVSIAICGVGKLNEKDNKKYVVTVYELFHIPYEKCSVRESDRVTWSSDILCDILIKAEEKNMAILKIHSHPNGQRHFSSVDDKADLDLFPRIAEWLSTDFPGISAIMLPDGAVFARALNANGEQSPVKSVLVAGPDILVWNHETDFISLDYNQRTMQAFGKGTVHTLSQLSIGIVGISGTGSPVVEQLYRLGVGHLVLVDEDIVKEVNLGRIYNSTIEDAKGKRKKVDVLANAIKDSGLPVNVDSIPLSLFSEDVIRKLSQCDILFGCMDSIEGRNILNKIAIFYSIPYFDIGVQLKADTTGGVEHICGAVHYLHPDSPTLLVRGVYSTDTLAAEVMKRVNPNQYKQLEDEGYIKGVVEDRPAVISVNTLMASLAVNDLLARLHNFRLDPNSDFDCIRVSLDSAHISYEKIDTKPMTNDLKYIGRGDMDLLLNTTIY